MKKFNTLIAELVTKVTGNMYFFWVALAFVLVLRLSHIPPINEVLLDVENDLQLLLLATAAVVQAKQQKHNENMLKKITHLEVQLLEKINVKPCVCPIKEKKSERK